MPGRFNPLFTRCVYVSPISGKRREMGRVHQVQGRQAFGEKAASVGPLLLGIATIAALLWFAPQTTSAVQDFLATVLALPVR